MKVDDSNDFSERETKRLIVWLIALMFVVGGAVWFFNRSVDVADTAIIHYEEFQEIYNTCNKLNTDLCNMKELPESDKMFEQFSKVQRLNTIKTNLNRWVEEYNSKSNMWKGKALPYQLSINDYSLL